MNRKKLFVFGLILLTLCSLYIGVSFFKLNSQSNSNKNNQLSLDKDGLQAAQGQVLAAEDQLGNVTFNVPAIFNQPIEVRGNITADGFDLLLGQGKVNASNVIYSITGQNGISVTGGQNSVISFTGLTGILAGDGITLTPGSTPTLTNTGVRSIQGATGAVTLQEGDGIAIDGTKITNDDPGSAQDIFKIIAVDGQNDISAGSNSDTLTFVAGANIVLTTDSTNKKLTIEAAGSASSGFTDDGTDVRLTTITDNVGIGTATPTSKLHVVGTTTISSTLTLGGSMVIGGDTLSDLTGDGLAASGTALTVNLTTSGTTGSTSSNSGLEVSSAGITLLKGCSTGELLKWNDATSAWECATDDGGTTGIINVQEGDVTISSAAGTLDFLGNDFALTESPAGEINVAIDYTNSKIARKDQNETVTGTWSFSNLLTASAGLTISGGQSLTLGGDTVSDLTGTGITLSGGSLQTTLGTSVDLTSEVNGTLPVGSGGTGATAYTAGSVVFSNGTILTQDNTNLFWDDTTNRLGIGDNTPNAALTVGSGDAFQVNSAGAITAATGVASSGNLNFTGSGTYTLGNIASGASFSGGRIVTATQTGALGTFADGSANQVLTTNGAGVYTWKDVGSILEPTNAFINNGNTFGAAAVIGTNDTNSFSLETDGTTRVTILATGNLGIGDATPASLFTVGSGDLFQVNSSGAIAAATGITSSGAINFTALSSGSGSYVCISGTQLVTCGGTTGDITSVGDVTSGAAFDGTQGNSLQFEGSSADGNETTLTAADPNADQTITLPNLTGTVALLENSQTFSGLKTFSAGATIATGQTFTVNGDAFTDLTGTGLTISGGALQTTLGVSVDLTSEVNGTLPVANGGTGAASFTSGGILTGNGSGALAISTAGTTGQALVSGGSGVPTWTTGALTLAGDLTTSGASSLTFTTTGATNVTLPTSGTLVTLAGTETLTNKTLTSPKILTSVLDTNGNTLLNVSAVGSAVNYLTLANATAGNNPSFTAAGSSTNIGINFTTKGTGSVIYGSTTANSDSLSITPNTSGAAAFTGNITSADLTGNRTYTLPDASGDFCMTSGNCAGVGGVGTITAVGNITSGGAFDGSQGTTLYFEGATPDGNEIALTSEDPGSDYIITLPALTGTVCLDSGNCSGSAGGSKWTDSGTLTYLTGTTDSVTIGSSTELAKLAVDGDADEVQLLVQGNGTQTSNLVVFETSAGADRLTLDNSGNLGIEGSLSDITDGTLTINDDLKVTGNDIIDSGDITRISLGSTTTLTNSATTLSGTTTLTASSLATFSTAATLDMTSTSTLNCTDCADFDDFKDALTLDASTSIALGASNLTLNASGAGNITNNLSSTGDFVIQDNGSTFLTFNDSGNTIWTLPAGNYIQVDAETVDSTTTAGVLDFNIDSSTDGNIGLAMDYQDTNTGASKTLYSIKNDITIDANATGNDTVYGLYQSFTQNDAAATAIGLYVTGEDKNYLSSNLGIGDTTPLSLLTVGNGDLFQVNSSGAIAAAAGITSSGTITFSGLSTGVVQSSSGGVLSSAAINLAGGGSYITGTLPQGNGGTGFSTYSTGNILYASAPDTLSKLAIGGTGTVLTVSAGVPSWATPTVAFTDITSGTNTVAAMIVGTGSSLNFTGSGTINASTLLGSTWASPGTIGSTTPNTAAFTSLTSTGTTTLASGAGNNVTLGNATGTFEVMSSNIDISTAGAITGATGVSSSGNLNMTGSGTYTLANIASGASFTNNRLVQTTSAGVLSTITDGGTNQVLTTDGAGNISWTSAAGVIAADSLDFTEFKDAMALDASTSIAFDANEVLTLDAASTDTTTTGGVLDFNIDAGNAAVIGLNMDFAQSNGATAGTDAVAQKLTLSANDADGDMFGLQIVGAATANAAAGSYENALFIDNAENTTASMTDAILITSSGINNGITDAIDVSAANINNAINAGANFISMDGIRMFEGTTGTLTFEDTSGNDLMTITDNGSNGSVAITNNLNVTGTIVANTDETINGLDINAGAISDATGISSTGAITFNGLGGSNAASFSAASAPTTDMVTISNSGFATTTTGVDSLAINLIQGTGAITNSALNISATGGSASGFVKGIVINNMAGTTSTSTALEIGTGWSYGILSNSNISIGDGTYLGKDTVANEGGLYNTSDLSIAAYNDASSLFNYGNNALVIDTSGNVNIGGDTTPNARFTVGNASQFTVNTSGEIVGPTNETINGIDISSGAISDVTSLAISSAASTSIALTRSSAGQWLSFNDGTDVWGLYNTAGSPEGALTANTGALSMDTTNGTLYVKTDDGDATGWVNLATGGTSPWQTTSNVTNQVTSTDNVTVGSATNLAKLGVDGDTDEIQFLVQGNATQTTGLMVLENSAGTDQFTVSNTGNVGIEGTISDITGATVEINDDLQVTGNDILDSGSTSRITLGATTTLTNTTTTLSGTTTITASSLSTLTTGATLGMASTSTLNCADCIDFDDMKDSLNIDAATDINLGTNAFTIDMDSTGDFSIRDGTTDIMAFTDSGAISITPTSGQNLTTTLAGAGAVNVTTATGSQTYTSSVVTGSTTTSGFVFDATAINTGTGMYVTSDSITTGKLMQIATTGNTLTQGTLLDINSTSTALTSGRLASLDWSPGSATTATGDLFRINIGSNGNVGNLFNITDNSSSLFSVSESAVTSSLPASFTAAGDVAIAYDLQFTNQTASYIKSNAPLYIESGESFESNDLTLRTFNSGGVILEGAANTSVKGSDLVVSSDGTLDSTNIGGTGVLAYGAICADDTLDTADDCIDAARTAGTVYGISSSFTIDDIGENFPTADESIDAGDIVALDYKEKLDTPVASEAAQGYETEFVKKATIQDGQSVMGIISAKPGVLLGGWGQKHDPRATQEVAVGLAGRIPVKVTSQNGPIMPGDFIGLSDTPGVGAKAIGTGYVIGKALDKYDNTDKNAVGTVLVFIQNMYYNPVNTPSSLAATSPESLTSTAMPNLLVSGKSELSDVVVTGEFVAGNLSITGLSQDGGADLTTLSGPLRLQADGLNPVEIMAGKVVIDTDGNILAENGTLTVKTVTAQKINIDNTQKSSASVGEGTIVSNSQSVTINTTAVTDKSQIFVTAKTLTDKPLSVTSKNNGSSFTVSISGAAPKDIQFSWWIVN